MGNSLCLCRALSIYEFKSDRLLEPQIGAVLGKILILALIILFIQKRPQGLFALKGRVID